MGTEFVVYIPRTHTFAKWGVFWTEDEERNRQFWMEDPRVAQVFSISEAEYWDLGALCKRLGVTLEGTVRR